MNAEFPILSLITFSPLFGVALVTLFRTSQGGVPAKISALVSSFLTLGLSVILWINFNPEIVALQFQEHRSWIPNLGISYFLGIDGLNLYFIIAVAFLTPLALVASWNVAKNWQFLLQMLLLQVAVLGCFVALDVILFYFFFELMLVPLYFLVGLWGRENRIFASNRFFIYTVLGSLFMLVAVVYTASLFHQQNGYWSYRIIDWYQITIPARQQILLFLGVVVAFSIKIPLFPFHTWLPDFHYEAPTAGSVEMAAIMMKLGPYGFIRFAMPVYPEAVATLAPMMIIIGLIGILYAGVVAIVQEDLKRLLAYSSVAHMGYIIIGVFAVNEQGLAGGLIQMVNYAVVTSAIFLCVGMLFERTGTQKIAEYGGVLKTMPIFSAFFILFSMASIGVPGLNGFVGEILAMLGVAQVNIWYGIVAASGVIVAAIYMLWMMQRIFFGPVTSQHVQNLKDLSTREIIVLVPLAFWTIALGIYPQFILADMNATIVHYVQQIQR